MKKAYRKGALGAMMDEYERAASELRRLAEQIPDDEFVRIVDPHTIDENCHFSHLKQGKDDSGTIVVTFV